MANRCPSKSKSTSQSGLASRSAAGPRVRLSPKGSKLSSRSGIWAHRCSRPSGISFQRDRFSVATSTAHRRTTSASSNGARSRRTLPWTTRAQAGDSATGTSSRPVPRRSEATRGHADRSNSWGSELRVRAEGLVQDLAVRAIDAVPHESVAAALEHLFDARPAARPTPRHRRCLRDARMGPKTATSIRVAGNNDHRDECRQMTRRRVLSPERETG